MRSRFLFAMIAIASSSPAFAGDEGKALYLETCSGCHQASGQGQPGLAPPLSDRALWGGLGDAKARYIAAVMLSGLNGTIDAQGNRYEGLAMPPQSQLSDGQLASVATYVLDGLNGADAHVAADLLAALRQKPLSHSEIRAMRAAAVK
ncbi:c-type cytochrome [Nguyenibacter vanlangensis]|uniref:Cytochrome c n=1 Tax=Nguyenibacter vanlangensis TaxID=1216886 RepID=A0A7Y7M703_9PROT|nr:cytochrome c [Nguyenibacter vanlangensis]NVN10898.1 cytochrome c [Nguyenibacter vanlangensis]